MKSSASELGLRHCYLARPKNMCCLIAHPNNAGYVDNEQINSQHKTSYPFKRKAIFFCYVEKTVFFYLKTVEKNPGKVLRFFLEVAISFS